MLRTVFLFWLPCLACAALVAAPVQALAGDTFDSAPAEESDNEEADDFAEVGLLSQIEACKNRPLRSGRLRPATSVARLAQVAQASPEPVLRNGLGAPLRR